MIVGLVSVSLGSLQVLIHSALGYRVLTGVMTIPSWESLKEFGNELLAYEKSFWISGARTDPRQRTSQRKNATILVHNRNLNLVALTPNLSLLGPGRQIYQSFHKLPVQSWDLLTSTYQKDSEPHNRLSP